MIELNTKSYNTIAGAVKNKTNKYVNILSKKADGATDLSRMILGKTNKERNQAAKALRGMIPDECGRVLVEVV